MNGLKPRDLVLVCFVPGLSGDGPGHLAVPESGSCDIEWHTHLYGDRRRFGPRSALSKREKITTDFETWAAQNASYTTQKQE